MIRWPEGVRSEVAYTDDTVISRLLEAARRRVRFGGTNANMNGDRTSGRDRPVEQRTDRRDVGVPRGTPSGLWPASHLTLAFSRSSGPQVDSVPGTRDRWVNASIAGNCKPTPVA